MNIGDDLLDEFESVDVKQVDGTGVGPGIIVTGRTNDDEVVIDRDGVTKLIPRLKLLRCDSHREYARVLIEVRASCVGLDD